MLHVFFFFIIFDVFHCYLSGWILAYRSVLFVWRVLCLTKNCGYTMQRSILEVCLGSVISATACSPRRLPWRLTCVYIVPWPGTSAHLARSKYLCFLFFLSLLVRIIIIAHWKSSYMLQYPLRCVFPCKETDDTSPVMLYGSFCAHNTRYGHSLLIPVFIQRFCVSLVLSPLLMYLSVSKSQYVSRSLRILAISGWPSVCPSGTV